MALRAAGLCRLALRSQCAAVRSLSSVAAGGEPPGGDDKPGRLVDLVALRRERAPRPPPEPARLPPSISDLGISTDWTVQLNAQIMACTSAEAVLDLVTPQLERLSVVNASTALTTIHKRAGKAAWLQRDARLARLLRFTARVFERMRQRDLAGTLFACGRLGVRPPADWLERFWTASALSLGEFTALNLHSTLYACGQLGVTPPPDWLQRYWRGSASKLCEFKPQELTSLLYACMQLGIMPPDDWLQRFWQASASKLDAFAPLVLSNTLYACGKLGIMPPADWLQHYWAVSLQKLDEFKPQGMSNTLYA